MSNRANVDRLRAYAAELSAAGGNLYRVRAVRRAALAAWSLPEEPDTAEAQAHPSIPTTVPGQDFDRKYPETSALENLVW